MDGLFIGKKLMPILLRLEPEWISGRPRSHEAIGFSGTSSSRPVFVRFGGIEDATREIPLTGWQYLQLLSGNVLRDVRKHASQGLHRLLFHIVFGDPETKLP